tara:strand:+ start:2494 stop:2646 length:153 start_codon:yes stop_codon:yes gene_type:complete
MNPSGFSLIIITIKNRKYKKNGMKIINDILIGTEYKLLEKPTTFSVTCDA